MPLITCTQCGAKVSDEFSYCFNCGNCLNAKERRVPSESRQGAVVGGFVGFLYGIYQAVQGYLTWFPSYMTYMISRISTQPSFASDPQLALSVVNVILYGGLVLSGPVFALLGYVLGKLFVKVKGRIPGSTIIRKSIVFGFILLTFTMLLNLGPSPTKGTVIVETSPLQSALQFVLYVSSFVVFPLLGWLYGYLLERRLKPREL